jgi:hypothetical protein
VLGDLLKRELRQSTLAILVVLVDAIRLDLAERMRQTMA